MAALYPLGSVQDAAFKAALTLPMPSEVDSGSSEPGFAALIMLSAGPEVYFPCAVVRCWLREAGIETKSTDCGTAVIKLHDAFVAMLNLEDRVQLLRDAALPNRDKTGAGKSLRLALSDIAQSATRLSADLQMVRHELLYRQTLGEDCAGLNRLHIKLHQAISFWHYKILRMAKADQPAISSLAPFDQCGLTPMALETWLELGLNSMAAEASKTLDNELDDLSHSGSRSARIREVFVRGVALAWREAVGVSPTVRGGDDGKLSPFQIFYRQVCGHTAGLLAREAAWTNLPTADQPKFRRRLQSLGLLTLPSASTLRRAINGAPNFPWTEQGKDRA